MLTLLLLVVAALAILGVAVVSLQPAAFSVARTATIAAPPAAVFAQVNDFHRWVAWSPYEQLDPAMHRTFDGPPSGVGAGMAWRGNARAGAGRVTITASRPAERVDIRLEMFKPFAGTNAVEFTFRPDAGGTAVTWRMTGRKNFVTKALHLVISLDRMLGAQFVEGLANLKRVAESGAAA